jgi:hypothetical protein
MPVASRPLGELLHTEREQQVDAGFASTASAVGAALLVAGGRLRARRAVRSAVADLKVALR